MNQGIPKFPGFFLWGTSEKLIWRKHLWQTMGRTFDKFQKKVLLANLAKNYQITVDYSQHLPFNHMFFKFSWKIWHCFEKKDTCCSFRVAQMYKYYVFSNNNSGMFRNKILMMKEIASDPDNLTVTYGHTFNNIEPYFSLFEYQKYSPEFPEDVFRNRKKRHTVSHLISLTKVKQPLTLFGGKAN